MSDDPLISQWDWLPFNIHRERLIKNKQKIHVNMQDILYISKNESDLYTVVTIDGRRWRCSNLVLGISSIEIRK